VLSISGVSLSSGLDDGRIVAWLFESGPRILVVALLTYVLLRAIALGTSRWEERLSRDGGVDVVERAKRARTVGSLVRNVLIVLVSALATLTILGELGVDIMPVVTGAGILGLAVGFGAQTLVRDVIAGFFLIFENHLRVGDVATIEGTGGIVEAISLRTTVMRDLEGTLHVFPNGSFERYSNRTKDYSYYVVDVGVAYKEDTDRVTTVLHEVGADLREDPAFSPHILAPLEVLGVDAFEESQVTIKVRIKTVPLKQWEVGRELRRRIKRTFDRLHIEIPFPHLSVYVGEASRPWRVESAEARNSDEVDR
jgi:small conductance mechanosensitive channel